MFLVSFFLFLLLFLFIRCNDKARACMSVVCLAHRLYHCTVSCVLTQFEQMKMMIIIVVVVNCMVMNCSRAAVTCQCKHIGDCADGAAYRPCVLRRPVFTQHVAASQSVHSLAVRSARRDADQHRR